MSQLPSPLCNALLQLAASPPAPAELARGVSTLLEAELRCADLCRGIEAFREAARVLGILEETRDGKRVYDAWGKLSHFFLEPLTRFKASFVELCSSLEPAPTEFESLGHKWERMAPELLAFLEEQGDLDEALQESPVSTHVSFRIRSRVLLLDRRAERAKVALELIRRDLTDAARQGAAILGGAGAAPGQPAGSSRLAATPKKEGAGKQAGRVRSPKPSGREGSK